MGSDLFVGNLDRSLATKDLEELFGRYGAVQRAQVIMDKETGQSKGFGFVTFSAPEEASEAINALNGYDWNGRQISVTEARGKKGDAPRNTDSFRPGGVPGVKELFVSGLDWRQSSDDLRDLFAPYGQVLKAKVITDRETRRSKGIGFVQMSSTTENEAAIQGLNGRDMNGRSLSVSEARERGATSFRDGPQSPSARFGRRS